MSAPPLARAALVLGLLGGSAVPGPRDHAAPVILTGRVTTAGGAPLYGANVTIDAAHLSVGTGTDGRYRIEVPEAHRGAQLVVRARAIGFVPQVRSVRFDRDSVTADFALPQDVNRLSQVVVTGSTGKVVGAAASALYGGGTAEAGRMPFTVAQVTADDLPARDLRGERYAAITDNPFLSPGTDPRSTFAVDVDRASYANVRRIITVDRQRPPVDAVRIEEMLNYFDYDYTAPAGPHPFALDAEVARAPWAPAHLLVRLGLQARRLDLATAPANNLVFLIDVSGSMQSEDKLPLLKTAFRLLVAQLRPQDRVAIVTYAGTEGLALPSTSGADKARILAALERLEAGGSTAGGAGLRLAYDVAKANLLPEGNNRVILATDGDFNVGITDNAELVRFVTARREAGIALSVLGFGAGNLQDERMEKLADAGNGNYNYIDSPLEARKVLVNEMGGTLVTVAKDVKVQVEFNPAVVARYRLIGYENRLLADTDFKDDRKDAGEIGAGHTVTALYEIVPVGSAVGGDTLRYARPVATAAARDELLFVRLRYKRPADSVSVPFEAVVPNRVGEASGDFRFAQAVAAFGMVLRRSEHRGTASAPMAAALAEGALGDDRFGYRREFVSLVRSFEALTATSKADPPR